MFSDIPVEEAKEVCIEDIALELDDEELELPEVEIEDEEPRSRLLLLPLVLVLEIMFELLLVLNELLEEDDVVLE